MDEKNQEPITKNRIYSYRNLVLWQKAQELALAVIKVVARLPRDPAAVTIAHQITRSARSIGANIAEGHGRYSLAAHRHHLSIAKASACETDSWLDLLRRADFMNSSTEEELHEACVEVIRMLTAKILQLERTEGSHERATRIREERAAYSSEDYSDQGPVLGSGL